MLAKNWLIVAISCTNLTIFSTNSDKGEKAEAVSENRSILYDSDVAALAKKAGEGVSKPRTLIEKCVCVFEGLGAGIFALFCAPCVLDNLKSVQYNMRQNKGFSEKASHSALAVSLAVALGYAMFKSGGYSFNCWQTTFRGGHE